MKKLLYFLFALQIFCIESNGQNWNLINSNYKYNFKDVGLGYITNTQFADSIKLQGADTVFYMKPTTYTFGNDSFMVIAPEFLQRKIKKQTNKYIFNDTANFVIMPYANIGFTWLFDTTQNISATIVSAQSVTTFGVLDSIKTIVLNTNDSIFISKNFGILQFSKPGIAKFILAGINETSYGIQVPWMGNIYNFDIGDLFYYYDLNPFPPHYSYRDRRVKVLGKQVFADSIVYSMNALAVGVQFPNPYISYWDYTYSQTYSKHYETYSNFYNGLCVGGTNLYNYQVYGMLNQCFRLDDTICVQNKYGLDLNSDSLLYKSPDNLIYRYEANKDTLKRIQWLSLGINDYYHKNNLGLTHVNSINFECSNKQDLIGYIKGTDTFGTWHPDTFYKRLVAPDAVNEVVKPKYIMNMQYFENTGTFKVQLNFEPSKLNTLQVLDINGNSIYKTTAKKETIIDLSSQPSGLYFVMYKGKDISLVGKLVNQ